MTNRILKELHESVTETYQAGVVNLATMKKFDKLCMIKAHQMKPEEIQHICKVLKYIS